MVKIVLIGKNRDAHGPQTRVNARFVALEFILNELRRVMVNPALPVEPARAVLSPINGDEPDLKLRRRRTRALGTGMPVQRKIFRIEQGALADASVAGGTHESGAALRRDEFMAEIKALRSLIEPRAAVDREAMEKGRAQIAEAQAYKAELDLIYAAMQRTRGEIEAFGAGASDLHAMVRAGSELDAIVAGTEQATQQVLQAAEEIDQSANMLSAALKSGHEQGLANDIRDQVRADLRGLQFPGSDRPARRQGDRILAVLEQHVGRLMEIWRSIEQFKPIVLDGPAEDDRKFLNGPKLAGDAGHSSQDDIDALFGCA